MDWQPKNNEARPHGDRSSSTLHGAIPLLDLGRENGPIHSEMMAALDKVVSSGAFIFGPECERLETQFAELSGARYAVGCASGSDALLLALMVHDIGPGDEVIVPSFTFFATASAAWRLGAKPVFVDIDPSTFCMDPVAFRNAINERTKAVIPVHLFGQCADMDPICGIAEANNVAVIEDCAQSVLASYGNRVAGSIGDVGCFSFYPTKNLGGCGDGGILTTSDEALYQKLRLYRAHGMEPRYCHHVVGINSRLDSMQAAVINVKLPHLLAWNDQRATNAANYTQMFTAAGLHKILGLPEADAQGCHVWNQYTIRVPDGKRDALRKHLADLSIGSEIYYPIPLHRQPCFATLGYDASDLPETMRAAEEVLSLPIFPELTTQEQQWVVDQIAEFCSAVA